MMQTVWMVGAALTVAIVLASVRAQDTQASTDRRHVYVSLHGESDAEPDGSREKPFASLTRALEAARAGDGSVVVHLDQGRYSSANGDEFPLDIPPRTTLEGAGSRATILEGKGDAPVLVCCGDDRRLRGLACAGGSSAISVRASNPPSDLTRMQLVDVAFERCTTGLELRGKKCRFGLTADGLRVESCATGILVEADASLSLRRCAFHSGSDGILVDAALATSVSLQISDGSFQDFSIAGIHCRNGAPTTDSPWIIRGCTFDGNEVGISFEIPAGDVPLEVRDCRFLNNRMHGVALVGSGRPHESATVFGDCMFRWNGTGLQLLSSGRPVVIERCRIEDSLGNGVFCGLFVGERSRVVVDDSLLVCNGASGVFALSEHKDGMTLELDHCTLADNLSAGLERKHRKSGSIELRMKACIVSGNQTELVRVEAAEVVDCLIGDATHAGINDNVGGDPRFLDRALRDYHLAPDSPARRADGPLGADPDVPRRGSVK